MLGSSELMYRQPKGMPHFVRGDVVLDDEFSRLYVVLKTWWCEELGRRYKVLVVADWGFNVSGYPNHVGQMFTFGDGVTNDIALGKVKLPVTL